MQLFLLVILSAIITGKTTEPSASNLRLISNKFQSAVWLLYLTEFRILDRKYSLFKM